METRKIFVSIAVLGVVIITIILLVTTLGGQEPTTSSEPSQADFLVQGECPSEYGNSKPLLVVCLDGFLAEYLDRGLTPTIKNFADAGVQAEYMIPSYPTVTFPNHYTIVTGLYPEAHGIIGNKFYDPVFKKLFSFKSSTLKEGRWWGGEPIWNTLKKEGKKSATYFWPGSEADINGSQPTYWLPYDNKKVFEERVEKVVEWLTLPIEDRPQWVSLYFNQPDKTGHGSGPDSEEMTEELKKSDGYFKLLLQRLREANVIHCLNIIILSDHGMAQAGKERLIALKDYIPDIKETTYFTGGALGTINLRNHSEELETNMIRRLACKRHEMRVYDPKWLPKRVHFSSNRRITDIIVDVDAGYSVSKDSSWASNGLHGYDNIFTEMNTIFMAYGPDFHKKLKVPPFQNIEVYNLMCHLTGVLPAPNNGTWGSLNHLLVKPPNSQQESQKSEKPPLLRYPEEDLVRRALASGCEGDNTILEPWMPSLDLREAQEDEIESFHAPWGIPEIDNTVLNISLLYHLDRITGYSSLLKLPLWTSFTMTSDQKDGITNTSSDSKWSSDARLDPEMTPTCSDYDILRRLNFSMLPLFPSAFRRNRTQAWDTSHLISNGIPVSQDIKSKWQGLLDTLSPSWIASHGPLNFILGLVFDHDSNSHPDDFASFSSKLVVPTDLFLVVTRCKTNKNSPLQTCPENELDSIAFIFHQKQPISNCLSLENFSLKYSCRVKDVELSTGLTMFPALPPNARIQQILRMHQQLWPLH